MALLAIRDLFGDREHVATKEIVTALNADEELPFGGYRDGKGLNGQSLGNLLKRVQPAVGIQEQIADAIGGWPGDGRAVSAIRGAAATPRSPPRHARG